MREITSTSLTCWWKVSETIAKILSFIYVFSECMRIMDVISKRDMLTNGTSDVSNYCNVFCFFWYICACFPYAMCSEHILSPLSCIFFTLNDTLWIIMVLIIPAVQMFNGSLKVSGRPEQQQEEEEKCFFFFYQLLMNSLEPTTSGMKIFRLSCD